jgi:putrescine aminotransferase
MSSDLFQLQELDRRHHLHPFTDHQQMHASGTHILRSGKGCLLEDAAGRSLLDGLAGLWCVNVGYGREEIVEAVRAQMERLPYYCSFFNSTTEPAVRLAARLADLAPAGLSHVAFSNSGSEANETALKIIRAYQRRRGRSRKRKILTRTFAYHGVTLATTSMTGLPTCYEPFDLPLEDFVHVPAPHPYAAGSDLSREEYGEWCVRQTDEIIHREDPATIAAFFVEPVQGAGGVIVPPEGYLAKLRQLCRENDILFVADEVITGFGRLGAWFASELWDLQPDLICCAKGLTSGYVPLGATIVSSSIADTLVHGGPFAHGFTYSGHPVACAAALANLDILETEGLIQRTALDTGPYFQQKLHALTDHPAVAEIRGFQLLGALELVPPGGRTQISGGSMLGVKAAELIRDEGVIVRGIRDLIAIAPPLIITHEQIDQLFAVVRRGLDRLHEM